MTEATTSAVKNGYTHISVTCFTNYSLRPGIWPYTTNIFKKNPLNSNLYNLVHFSNTLSSSSVSPRARGRRLPSEHPCPRRLTAPTSAAHTHFLRPRAVEGLPRGSPVLVVGGLLRGSLLLVVGGLRRTACSDPSYGRAPVERQPSCYSARPSRGRGEFCVPPSQNGRCQPSCSSSSSITPEHRTETS